MKTGRNILISAILALSGTGAIAAAVAVPAVTAGSVVAAGHANPDSFYHG